MLRASFALNVRRPSYVASHTALFLTALIVGVSLALAPKYLIIDNYSSGFFGSKADVQNLLGILFAFLLLYTLLRGVFSQGVRNYMTTADNDFLALTPINAQSLVVAKCVRNLVSRLSIALLAFFVMFPSSLVLKTPLALFFAALLSLTLYIEFLQALSVAVQSISDAVRFRVTKRVRYFLKTVTLTVLATFIIIVLLSAHFQVQLNVAYMSETAEQVWSCLPSAIAASSIVDFMSSCNSEATIYILGLQTIFISVSLAATYVSSKFLHPEHLSSPLPVDVRYPLGFRIGSFIEKRFSWKKPSRIVFLKDLHLTLRGAMIDFSVLNYVFMYVVSLTAWFLMNSVLPLKEIPNCEEALDSLRMFVKEFVLILTLMPFIPALTSFSREHGKLWILKSFPFKSRETSNGKFLFALAISAVSLAPMVLAASWVFNITFSEWMFVVLLPLIVLIANSFGVLVGAYLPPYDLNNQMSIKSTGTFFISLVFILAPFTLVASADSLMLKTIYVAVLAAYSFLVTNIFLEKASKGFEKMELRKVLPGNQNPEQPTSTDQ
ncbi:hypothetical protein KEJ18_04610 [Candidatus Bathyarchaeota archaeon]|nr:hypothetical protein [Candidatus Bathyarchaeota archaeon]